MGRLYVVKDIQDVLARGLEHDFLDEETVNKALAALEDGTLSFNVTEREQSDLKGWMGKMLSFE